MKRFILLLFLFLGSFAFTSSIPVHVPIESSQQKETVVYETRTGKRYHRGNCHYLRQSKIQTTKAQAEKKGLTPCKVCKP